MPVVAKCVQWVGLKGVEGVFKGVVGKTTERKRERENNRLVSFEIIIE